MNYIWNKLVSGWDWLVLNVKNILGISNKKVLKKKKTNKKR
jgi:hypothetical protein